MNDLLRKVALSLVNKQIAAHRDELHAFVNAQVDVLLEKGEDALEGADLPAFVKSAIVGSLNDADLREQLHQVVDAEVDDLLAQLVSKLQ